jgi:hypothetical protein
MADQAEQVSMTGLVDTKQRARRSVANILKGVGARPIPHTTAEILLTHHLPPGNVRAILLVSHRRQLCTPWRAVSSFHQP